MINGIAGKAIKLRGEDDFNTGNLSVDESLQTYIPSHFLS